MLCGSTLPAATACLITKPELYGPIRRAGGSRRGRMRRCSTSPWRERDPDIDHAPAGLNGPRTTERRDLQQPIDPHAKEVPFLNDLLDADRRGQVPLLGQHDHVRFKLRVRFEALAIEMVQEQRGVARLQGAASIPQHARDGRLVRSSLRVSGNENSQLREPSSSQFHPRAPGKNSTFDIPH